jgi:ribosomal protein S1
MSTSSFSHLLPKIFDSCNCSECEVEFLPDVYCFIHKSEMSEHHFSLLEQTTTHNGEKDLK